MKLRLKSRSKEIVAGLKSKNHSLTLLMSYKQRGAELLYSVHLGGTDLDKDEDYKWLGEELPLDKELVVILSNDKELRSDRSYLVQDDLGEIVDREKVKYFHRLK